MVGPPRGALEVTRVETEIEVQSVQGDNPHVAAGVGLGKNLVRKSADIDKEQENVSVNDEKLLKLGVQKKGLIMFFLELNR